MLRIITVTSDNYVASTSLMLESLRLWHPQTHVTVYALEQGWNDGLTRQLAPLASEVTVITETDPAQRLDAHGGNVYCAWKLDVLARQSQPFLYLDSDILILRPLDRLFDIIRQKGWATCREGTTLGRYAQGDAAKLVHLPEQAANLFGFNAGVLGCDPAQHPDLFHLARAWVTQVPGIYLGDQGLLNLAYFHLHGKPPEESPNVFNGGWGMDDRIDLTHTLIHFARPNYGGPRKLHDQSRIWAAWPHGIKLVNLDETDFWRQSLPHPWPWLNQCVQGKHRAAVQLLRQRSRSLRGIEGLVLRNAYEAHLLHPDVRREVDAYWRAQAQRFRDVPHAPTYHLADGRVRRLWPAQLRQKLWNMRPFAGNPAAAW